MHRQIPIPGVKTSGGALQIPAIIGQAGCDNLIADSPPTLLESYEIYSFSIGVVVVVDTEAPAAGTAITIELALLVNDRLAYTATQVVPARLATETYANAMFVSDLTNPIRLGARDRLGLRLGAAVDDSPSINNIVVAAGTTFDPSGFGSYAGFESTISYDVLDMPASRRL